MDVFSLTNVVYTQCRLNIESTLIQRHYFQSALTQCQFVAARPAEVVNTFDTYIVSDFGFTVHK